MASTHFNTGILVLLLIVTSLVLGMAPTITGEQNIFDFISGNNNAESDNNNSSSNNNHGWDSDGENTGEEVEGQKFDFKDLDSEWDTAEKVPITEWDGSSIPANSNASKDADSTNNKNKKSTSNGDSESNTFNGLFPILPANQEESPTIRSLNPCMDSNTTLWPLEKRQCKKHSTFCCVHGVCSNGIDCVCDKGWIGIVCNEPCTLKCFNGGVCALNYTTKPASEITEDDMYCNCDHLHNHKMCRDPIPDYVKEAEMKGERIAIILGCCLTVVLVTSIIIPIVLWKKRVIFIMRIVYFFKMWEDDDGKIYDAYISMGTTGKALKFVKDVLVPGLESKGFHLYIPGRDQLCGDVISEKILTAIKQSRRTIMVVTSDYLVNEWSRFEVLIAQMETIKLKQRIIPIILEDVTQDVPRMQKSLQHILDSVKCLKVPEYKLSSSMANKLMSNSGKKVIKFWRRLELTMPKKRSVNCERKSDVESNITLEHDIHSLKEIHCNSGYKNHTSTPVEIDQGDNKKYGTMIYSKISPFSLYQNGSSGQEIDPTKFEQFFNFN